MPAVVPFDHFHYPVLKPNRNNLNLSTEQHKLIELLKAGGNVYFTGIEA
jgi:hypothetical protein